MIRASTTSSPSRILRGKKWKRSNKSALCCSATRCKVSARQSPTRTGVQMSVVLQLKVSELSCYARNTS